MQIAPRVARRRICACVASPPSTPRIQLSETTQVASVLALAIRCLIYIRTNTYVFHNGTSIIWETYC